MTLVQTSGREEASQLRVYNFSIPFGSINAFPKEKISISQSQMNMNLHKVIL